MQNLTKLLFSLSLAIFATVALADQQPLLNKISYQLSAEQWVTTATAQVDVNVDVSAERMNLADINQQILRNLSKLTNDNQWYILNLNLAQDKSGLQQLHIAAQARLPIHIVNNLYNRLNEFNKSGVTYRIVKFEMVPSLTEIEKARTDVRTNIYNAVKTEIDTLNKLYPNQNYFVHSVDFLPPPVIVSPMNTGMAIQMTTMNNNNQSTAVSNKITETASVVLYAQNLPTAAN